jgi:cytochrome c peroxidase
MNRYQKAIGCAVAASVLAGAAGIMVTRSFATAVVGETRTFAITKPSDPSLDKMRASYKRPQVIPFPKDNPYTAEKAALGKTLFFDTRLSSGNLLSCASCHSPAYGWGDGQPVGVGHLMKKLGRRSPTIINSAYSQIYMWDGRAGSLEEQALGPIQADVEMAMPLDELLKRLNAIGEYKALFDAAFPGKGITPQTIAHAIATYERTVISGRAPFDSWIDGDEKAISDSAKRGFVLFNTKAQCHTCHSGWNFTDDSFHDIGLKTADLGRGKFLEGIPKAQHAFKTPGLREITRRGPYMHNGSLATLEEVVDHYNHAGINRESRSDLIKELGLTQQEKADLVAFMKTLTSDVDPTTVPVLPR